MGYTTSYAIGPAEKIFESIKHLCKNPSEHVAGTFHINKN